MVGASIPRKKSVAEGGDARSRGAIPRARCVAADEQERAGDERATKASPPRTAGSRPLRERELPVGVEARREKTSRT